MESGSFLEGQEMISAALLNELFFKEDMIMPGFDKKGPLGSGPAIGKSGGMCNRSDVDPLDMSGTGRGAGTGRGSGMGRGGGSGMGRCRNTSGSVGRGGDSGRRCAVPGQSPMNQVDTAGSDEFRSLPDIKSDS